MDTCGVLGRADIRTGGQPVKRVLMDITDRLRGRNAVRGMFAGRIFRQTDGTDRNVDSYTNNNNNNNNNHKNKNNNKKPAFTDINTATCTHQQLDRMPSNKYHVFLVLLIVTLTSALPPLKRHHLS